MDDKLAKRIETMLKKSEIILKSGKKLRVPRVHYHCDSYGIAHECYCGECYSMVQTDFKYCPYCGKLLYW